MTIEGVAWATALNKISFPPRERNLWFHPHNLLHTLSLTYSKNAFLFQLMMTGSPTYFPASPEFAIPNMEHSSNFVASGTFGLKDIVDFCKFIH